MVFESLVVDLINKYLGEYVVKLDKSQLKLGLLGGNATLENLDIKENALDSFDLPVRVIQGHISKITLKIPWKHLYSEPVIAELDGLYVLIVPNSGIKYNPERERIYKLEAKQRELNRIEEAKAKRNETKKESDSKDSFGEKLAAQIVKNLQIKITNIHIRYEDTTTSPAHPLAVGITLANLSFQTCDSNGESIVIKDDSTREFFKSVKMDCLAVYWNSKPPQFSGMTRGMLKNAMNNTICSSENKVQTLSYIIRPISSSAMMHVHMRPELTNFTVPQLTLNLTMDQIGFAFTRDQYCDLMNFLDSVDRVWTQSRFLRYKPQLSLKGNVKIWWKFPYNVILEEQVRRRRLMWSWEHIRNHRKQCRTYAALWEHKLMEQKLSGDQLKTIETCEEELDLLNLTLCRQQAEMNVKKHKKKINQQKASTGGWFSGWFGARATSGADSSSSQNTDSTSGGTGNELQSRVRNEFTQEEKAKLYQAIGYSDNVKDPDIPKEYVSLKLDVILHKLTFVLIDDSLTEKKLMKLAIHSLSTRVHQRSSANAIKVGLLMTTMQVTGSVHEDGTIPTLVSTQRVSQAENLLKINFETNPMNCTADQKLSVRAEPLEIAYDAATINRVVKFFTPPEELRLYELSTQVMASIEEVKEMTATGIRHMAEQRLYTDISIDVKPSYFILPDNGVFSKNCRMLLIDLGSINVQSERTSMIFSGDAPPVTKSGKLDYDIIKETAYDKFHITLSTIQILFINRGDDWRKLRHQPTSHSHILRPFGFEFNLKKCLISNDANLPKIFLEGCLPHLNINISNKALHNILQLILHIPFPQTEPPKMLPKAEELLNDADIADIFVLAPTIELSSNQIIRRVGYDADSDGDNISIATSTATSTNEDQQISDDEFYDTSDGSTPVGRKKSATKLKEKARKQNIVDLDSVFKINKLELEVFEEPDVAESTFSSVITDATNESKSITVKPIITVSIQDVGASVTLRRFDMYVNAYVGELAVEVPQLEICIAKTKRRSKAQKLMSIELIIAEKAAPDFRTTYRNTRHQLKCEFKSLEICMHQEALLLVMNFFQQLLPALNDAGNIEQPDTITHQATWSQKVGDEEMSQALTFEQQQRQADSKINKFKDTSVVGLVTEQMEYTKEKRSVRLSAERDAARQESGGGKRIIIPESSMIQWNVSIEMEKVRVLMANNALGNILDISVHGMKANVSMNYHTTEVAVTIDDMRIQDPQPVVMYKKIIWIDPGESVFTMQVVIFNEIQKDEDYLSNLNKVDMSMNLNIGKIKIIFLYTFVNKISMFLDSFQSSIDLLKEQAQVYSDAALQQVASAIEEPPTDRFSLKINIDAPVFYIPENSKSMDALMLDLGSLSLHNSLRISELPSTSSLGGVSSDIGDSSTNNFTSTILDVMEIKLQNLRLCRAVMMETSVKNEKGILRPININLTMTRNMSYPSYSALPAINVIGEMESITVGMNNRDYHKMVCLLQSNLAEGSSLEEAQKEGGGLQVDRPSMSRPHSVNTGQNRKLSNVTRPVGRIEDTPIKRISVLPDDVINIKFQFILKGIEVNLFKRDDELKDWQESPPEDRCLSKLNCQYLIIEGIVYANSAVSCSVRLTDIALYDTQPLSIKRHINKLIYTETGEEDFILIKFQQDKKGDSRLLIDIAGIYMCVYMDFLMQLTNFFVVAQPPPIVPSKKKMINIRGHEENPRKYRRKPQKPIVEPRLNNFEMQLNLKRPELMLVENIEDENSNVILLGFEIVLKMGMLRDCDIINGNIENFTAVFCPFQEEKRLKHSLDIIAPTSIALYCNKPQNDGMQGSVTMEELIINITPAVIQSISRILQSLQHDGQLAEPSAEGNVARRSTRIGSLTVPQYEDVFWEMQYFNEEDFPFIAKAVIDKQNMNEIEKEGNEEVECGFDVAQLLLDVEQRRADQIYIRMPSIRIVLESEVAKKCVPMFILESSVDGTIKNPLTQINVCMTMCMSVSYFNDHINEWEPLIETYPDDNNRQYNFELEYTTCDDSSLFADEDQEDLANVEPSKVTIVLTSRDNLELTISRTSLDVLSNLGKAFEQAYAMNLEEHRNVVGAPYVFKNVCGIDVELFLSNEFDFDKITFDNNDTKSLILKHNGPEIHLSDNKVNAAQSVSSTTSTNKGRFVKIGLVNDVNTAAGGGVEGATASPSFDRARNLLVHKTEMCALRMYSSSKQVARTGVSDEELNTIVANTNAYLGMKNVSLQSILQVTNSSDDDMNLYYRLKSSHSNNSEMIFLSTVPSKKNFYVPIPILINSTGEIFIQVPGLKTKISKTGLFWKIPRDKEIPETQILECPSDNVSFYFAVQLHSVKINVIHHHDLRGFLDPSTLRPLSPSLSSITSETNQQHRASSIQSALNSDSQFCTFLLDIRSPLQLHNQLPINMTYQSQSFSNNVESGCMKSLRSACVDKNSQLKLAFEYQSKEWFGILDLRPKMDELNVVVFKAREGFTELTMNLGVHISNKDGTYSVTVYSPYWMINKTGHTLTYKAGDEYIVEHSATNQDAVLFSFLSKSIFSHKKAYLKINDSNWSDKFSLDTVGSSGKIILKKKPHSYEVGIKISLSSSGLTKIVTFMPYYVIINQSHVTLLCNELAENAGWIEVPPNEAVPFWPRSEVGKSMLMRCKITDNDVIVTQPFSFYESHSILMKLEKKYVGIFVEVQISEEANLITLQLYQNGMALVQIVNHLGDDVNICFKQQGTNQETDLQPNHSIMYAWQDSRQKRELVWHVEGDKKTHTNNLTSDGIEDFFINEMKAYWISFVWDMHRILLFTNDIYVAKNARLSTELEAIDMEIVVCLQSLGLSLVDNDRKEEISYISITSSGVRWNQIIRKNRHKPLKMSQSDALEVAYDDYANKIRTGGSGIESIQDVVQLDGGQLEVDIGKKLMLRPEKCELTRVFEPGVYLQYRTSPHQMHLHVRIFRIQIDNQMRDHTFPVVFAPYPPPRSVALDTGLKPLIELSAVIGKTGDSGSMRFKYFRVLIQEMQVMLDQGFVNSMLDFVSNTVPDFNEEEMFKVDKALIDDKLLDTATIKAILQGGKKCVFDNFHISPIKLHLSFSLAKINQSGKTALHSEVLNLFLQSVGIAVTDMQDVIFKLGYFEKQNSIMPVNQMVESMVRHYMSQALRQMYVLVLGLDVIGNPFGVIRGMAQGVEDLFYEPVRGAVLGPEEFVEGMAYGVKSLFGHAVGGAAGAMSRIVGTMGKGIAALTLDADYQKKRREQLARKPENFGVGLAQGGKGLVTGVFSGITGIVTKPIDGAKKDGVEGFFKGMGKGLVGVVTRPVSGVVDFASSSFEGIRRVADTNIEVVRIRPPRYIPNDGVIHSYGLREAEGNNIWRKLAEKNNTLQSERYEYHVYCKSKKTVLFLTNMRVLHLEKNDILAIWQIYWQMPFDKLDGVPVISHVNKSGGLVQPHSTSTTTAKSADATYPTKSSVPLGPSVIVFTLKEKQRRLFMKDNVTKQIEVDVGPAKVIITKIMEIMKKNNLLPLHTK